MQLIGRALHGMQLRTRVRTTLVDAKMYMDIMTGIHGIGPLRRGVHTLQGALYVP